MKIAAHKIFLALSLVIGLKTLVYAEPSKDVQTFINEPVTMLDWGMFKLGLRFEKYLEDRPSVILGVPPVTYDWDANSIIIKLIKIMEDNPDNMETALDWCNWEIYVLNRKFRKYENDGFCEICSDFKPKGFITSAMERDIQELKKRIKYHFLMGDYICEQNLYSGDSVSIRKAD